jgi:hypothetical protein
MKNLHQKKYWPIATVILITGTISISVFAIIRNKENIIYLHSEQDFEKIRKNLAGHYVISSKSIDFSKDFLPIGTPDAPFTGVLDGNGYAIDNFWPSSIQEDETNLFGVFGCSSGTIKNLTIYPYPKINEERNDANVAETYFGFITGINRGNILNCQILFHQNAETKVTFSSKSALVFGCIAGNNFGNIEESKTTQSIQVFSDKSVSLGGIVGTASKESTINKCDSRCNLSAKNVDYSSCVGGISGAMESSSIKNALFKGEINNVSSNGASYSGGITAFGTSASHISLSETYSETITSSSSNFNFSGGVCGVTFSEDLLFENNLSKSEISQEGDNLFSGEIISLPPLKESETKNNYYLTKNKNVTNEMGTFISFSNLSLSLLGWDPNIWGIANSEIFLLPFEDKQ